LTEPYLTLTINKFDDIVAFFALAACGLIAAAFGRRRQRWSEASGRTDRELIMLSQFVDRARSGRSTERLLRDLQVEFGLSGLTLRDAKGNLLAATPEAAAARPTPRTALTGDTLFATEDETVRFGAKGMRLPDGGGQLTLQTGRGPVTLELWEGREQGFSRDERRTLAIAASILALATR
jgi:hypothetical protein